MSVPGGGTNAVSHSQSSVPRHSVGDGCVKGSHSVLPAGAHALFVIGPSLDCCCCSTQTAPNALQSNVFPATVERHATIVTASRQAELVTTPLRGAQGSTGAASTTALS